MQKYTETTSNQVMIIKKLDQKIEKKNMRISTPKFNIHSGTP